MLTSYTSKYIMSNQKINFYCGLSKSENSTKWIEESFIFVGPGEKKQKKVINLRGSQTACSDLYPNYYIMFNTFDGTKNAHYVNDANEIDSIVLEYKITNTIIKINREMKLRNAEIKKLKEERIALCELIDETSNSNETICNSIKERHSRFFGLDSVEQINKEFELINEQIHIHNNNIDANEKQIEEAKNHNYYKNVSIIIPHGTIARIKTKYDGYECEYDCYWTHNNPNEDMDILKKRNLILEIDEDELTKKYIESI
jgi:hypothetical protein